MITEHFTVVGSENNQTIFQSAGILNQAPDLIVNEINHPVIGSASSTHIVVVETNFPSIWVQSLLGVLKFGCPIANHGWREIPLDVALIIMRGWGQWWMWVYKGDIEEKRNRRVAFLQEIEGAINTPKRVHLFFR